MQNETDEILRSINEIVSDRKSKGEKRKCESMKNGQRNIRIPPTAFSPFHF